MGRGGIVFGEVGTAGRFRCPCRRQGASATGTPTRTGPPAGKVDFGGWNDGTIVALAAVARDEFPTDSPTPLRGEINTAPPHARGHRPSRARGQAGCGSWACPACIVAAAKLNRSRRWRETSARRL